MTVQNKLTISSFVVVDIEPTEKIKRFSIRNDEDRKLLYNFYSSIPNKDKNKCPEFWKQKQQELIEKHNLNVCLATLIKNFSKYKKGYPQNDY
jgi:hypothetical protein